MKVVLFCGGQGMRLREYSESIPKPWFTEDTFWALLRLRGIEGHSPTRFAEAFHAPKMILAGPAG